MVTQVQKSLNPTGTQLPGTANYSLNTGDFIKMMVTQLQNQDPTQPEQSGQLLQQMSQIGQLQASSDLTTNLKGMVLQNQIGTAGNLIGKLVQGMDTDGSALKGVVTSVKVASDKVSLELDSGKTLGLDHITSVSAASTIGTAAAPATH